MLSDEQLIVRLRAGLERETAGIDPSPSLLASVHAPCNEAPRSRRRPWSRLRLAHALIGLSAVVTIGVAGLALALIGHSPAQPAATGTNTTTASPPLATGARPATPTTAGPGPAQVSAAAVAASVQVSVLPAARYCAAAPTRLVACHPEQQPVFPQPRGVIELSVLARRGAGRNSWYAWNVTAPPACAQAGAGGPTRGTVRAGTRLIFDTLITPGCRGTVRASVFYVSQAPRTDSERFALVGRRALVLPTGQLP